MSNYEVIGDWKLEADQLPAASRQPPLHDKRIVITRSAAQADSFGDKLAQLGAEPIVFPVIAFTPLPTGPLDAALAHFDQYDWVIFTSVNAVDFFFRRVDSLGLTLKMPRVATVGSATAVALQSRRITIDFIPDEFTGEALAAGLGDLTGQRILLPRARVGRPEIVALLRGNGAEVDDVALYDTVTAVPTPEAIHQLEQGFDVVTFTSPSSVRNFLKIIGESRPGGFSKPFGSLLKKAAIACIGPVTADEVRRHGLSAAVVPDEYTVDGLTQAIVKYYEERYG